VGTRLISPRIHVRVSVLTRVVRLRIIAKKLVQNLPAEKREGSSVATSVFRQLTQDPTQSSAMAVNLLARLESSPTIVERLASEPEAVVKDMEELRNACESIEDFPG
jgi:hypothetical protein